MRKTSEQRKREIVGKALEIVNSDGPKALTTSRLAAAVGLSEAALYRHFPSKSAIIVGLAAELERRFENVHNEVVRTSDTVKERLAVLLKVQSRLLARQSALPATIALSVLGGDRQARMAFARIARTVRRWLEEIFEQGVRSGELRVDLDTKQAAAFFHFLLVGHGTATRAGVAPDLQTRMGALRLAYDALRNTERA
jgi:TetR/AcrR family transcriptional regulator